MRPLPSLVLLAACGPSAPPLPEVPDLDPLPFDAPRAATAIRLTADDARLVLPDGNLPPGDAVPEAWTLGPETPVATDDGRSEFLFDLPFPVTDDERRFRPVGMTVHQGDVEIPFDMSPRAHGHAGWRIKGGRLLVSVDEALEALEVTVRHPRIREAVSRLDRRASGLDDAAFATMAHTIGGRTDAGLFLPAPATATWRVDLPEGARFDTIVRMIAPPLSGESDGARVTLTVTAGGAPIAVASRAVSPPGARPGWLSRLLGPTDDTWAVDLSRWAGQTVDLSLVVDPAGTAEHDHVFFGAPAISGTPTAPPRRIVVLAVDTLRPDHLGAYGYPRPTSPELDAFAADSVLFERAWAPAPRTRPSFRSATTGRGALDAVGATNIAEVFADAGFATAGFVANIHLTPRFGFHRGFDRWELHPSDDAAAQVDRALAWLADHPHRDTYLFLHLMDPHLFYAPPAPYDTRFVGVPDPDLPEEFNRWTVLKWMADGTLDARRADHIEARYDGEIAYTSAQVQRFLDGLDALPGDSLVVFHSDHGEEFWEHGGFEHNHALWDEVVRVALWFRLPPPHDGLTGRLTEPVALWDIAPTLYDVAGLTGTPPTDGRSLLPLMTGADPGGWDRPLPIGHLMYDREQWGVVAAGHKYVIETASGEEHLYDLDADPWEEHDLAGTADLDPFRAALARAHGMPVGPGWRVHVDLKRDAPLEWALPAPALAAGVIDPEAARPNRANQVWGEVPPKRPDDVARVTLSDDGLHLTAVPGRAATGTLYVLFAAPPEDPGLLTRAGEALIVYPSDGGWRARGPRTTLKIVPGTVLVPPPGEAARISGQVAADGDTLSLLEALGYVGATPH